MAISQITKTVSEDSQEMPQEMPLEVQPFRGTKSKRDKE